jgi:hypothetical protein
MSENLDDGNQPLPQSKKMLKDATALTPPADTGNGATAPNGQATNGNGAHDHNVVPMPMPAEKEGLTLESLQRATASGDAVPLVTIASTAVVIDVAKPTKGAPFRAHPDVAYTMNGYSLTTKTPGVIGEVVYLLDPTIAELIPAHVRYQRFCLCFDAWQRKPFIWPITVQVEGDRGNAWVTSATRIWNAAKDNWVCMIPVGGAYQLHKPVVAVKGEPAWPNKPFAEIMIMGFKDLYIGPDDNDHPEITKRLTVLVPE